jgi:hypothetical protein
MRAAVWRNRILPAVNFELPPRCYLRRGGEKFGLLGLLGLGLLELRDIFRLLDVEL